MAGGILLPFGCQNQSGTGMPGTQANSRTNWAGNYTYKAPNLKTPSTFEELVDAVKSADIQKALGSKHCFNNIADSPQTQISMENLNKVISIDKVNNLVTIEGGIRYGDLAPQLEKEGFALHNLASLPHISVAGACITGTHGSGVSNGNLSTAVKAIEFITPNADIIQLSDEQPEFFGAVVNLGALGIISKLTLKIEPTYQVIQDVFIDLPLENAIENFHSIMGNGYSVSLFTDWMNKRVNQIWVKRKVSDDLNQMEADYFGAKKIDRNVHPIIELSAENCTEQLGIPGAWYERLPHFKMGFTPSSGDELQSEFFVAKENAVEAFLALEAKREQIFPHLFISEIRSIAADQLWLSPAFQKDVIAFHFTWKPHENEVIGTLIPMIENELAPFDVKPHWGKLFSVDSKTLNRRYPKMGNFLAMAEKYDPNKKLKNAYLERNIFS